jgi:3-hydroxybutyrate dehydrogenase
MSNPDSARRVVSVLRHVRPCATTAARSDQPLNGKVALTTGSTSGIGLAVAEALAAAGAAVVLNGFGPADKIEALCARLRAAYGCRVMYCGADMSKPGEIEAMVREVQQKMGSLDIVVNNAGIQHVSPVESFPTEKWDAIMAINCSSAFHTAKHALPGMRQRAWGRIVNVASAHGLVGSPHKAAYVAAKHGVIGLTKVVALECAGQGITANCICPGWVLTPLVQAQIEKRAAASGKTIDEEKLALVAEKHPSKDFVQPAHIGAMCVFLCSDGAAQITGTSMPIDGGWTAQ